MRLEEQTLEKKIVEIIAGICGVEPEEITPELDLFEEGLLDSFGAIQMVLALEDAFSVSLQIENIPREKITTPAKIAALIQEALA